MKNSFAAQCVAVMLASSLLALPGLAIPLPQSTQAGPMGQQAPQSPAQQSPAQTPSTVPPSQQPQAPAPANNSAQQQAKGNQPNYGPLPQQTNPNVKPGSIDDVNAIGNRGVGGGLDFYSLE
jgi:beta-barrel assembly-enhancing protease